MKSYIVRIYRNGEEAPHKLVGQVIEAGMEKKKLFHTVEELGSILNGEKTNSKERRKSERLKLKLNVMIRRPNDWGRHFLEYTILDDLSPYGASFITKKSIKMNKAIELLIDPSLSKLEISARVVSIDNGKNGNIVRVAFEKK